jgi:hypothetical protein
MNVTQNKNQIHYLQFLLALGHLPYSSHRARNCSESYSNMLTSLPYFGAQGMAGLQHPAVFKKRALDESFVFLPQGRQVDTHSHRSTLVSSVHMMWSQPCSPRAGIWCVSIIPTKFPISPQSAESASLGHPTPSFRNVGLGS